MVRGQMQITRCKLQHGHELQPGASQYMVNYRSIDDPTIDKIVNNDRAGIFITKNYRSLQVENGGYENITFNQRDLRNVVNLERRKTRFTGDAIALEEYFKKQHNLNNNFYSEIQRDCEGRYKMQFAPFVGVNHHGSSIVFASALISHEDADTFEWVLNQWLIYPEEFDEAWDCTLEKFDLRDNNWLKETYALKER
ncbi:protein FAR1-RELATED SEQUENCE 5-like [Chenopodium quinoa]|uniref:protein FAR1-RELATED SEQUENCE 5-like n=1 Tax=Chenopodium quinoa TaxID=63459 RepID=UPI000B786FB0|nr:protein FAR1-RELATED SEQUENCE 5-like [Chenopodium quinoa]